MMELIRQNWLINRRQVLRGLGVSIALPLLDCMRPLRAIAAKQGPKPRRSAFIYLPNGVNTLDYQITEEGVGYKFTESLRPLEKHRMNITPISGLYHPNGLGHHHNCRKIWLTGGKLGQVDRNSISVDQLMAQVTAPHTRFASMELSNKGGSLSWNPDGIQLPAQSNPGVVFRDFFEEPKEGIAKQR
ncbi:TPA: DUF1552 domain-containing protein, partial [Candidatus Poribacteria bacterium]|nr:DUF1552 domain-containing protein [Candidatus Poribacteria bacterium]